MPFPWKKGKSTRISQLVNDHLHKSQKRRDGSSLVVETGFPTSLIDLFIKNREKLKKTSKRKHKNPPNTPIGDDNDKVIAGSPLSFPSPLPPPPPSIAGSPSPPRCPSSLRNPSFPPLPVSCVSKITVSGLSGGDSLVGVDERKSGDERGAGVNTVLLGVLKMFLVVVLALGTKRMTVGITISAFLLLFLEYVGKYVNGLLKPCAGAKGVLKSMAQSVWRSKEVKLEEKNIEVLMRELQQEHSMNSSSTSLKSSASRFPNQEIQVVEPKGNMVTHVEEIQLENEIMDASCSEDKLGCQEIELVEVVMEKDESMRDTAELKRISRRTKIKSKMKKFVPKKFKHSRKEHDLQRPEIVKHGHDVSSFEQVYQNDNAAEPENASIITSISGGRHKEEDCTNVIFACGRLPEVSEEADMRREEKVHEFEAGLSWRFLVLCLIVLIGLIGGRAFALVLTLSWFLLLQLGEILPRYLRIPVIKSFNNKSG